MTQATYSEEILTEGTETDVDANLEIMNQAVLTYRERAAELKKKYEERMFYTYFILGGHSSISLIPDFVALNFMVDFIATFVPLNSLPGFINFQQQSVINDNTTKNIDRFVYFNAYSAENGSAPILLNDITISSVSQMSNKIAARFEGLNTSGLDFYSFINANLANDPEFIAQLAGFYASGAFLKYHIKDFDPLTGTFNVNGTPTAVDDYDGFSTMAYPDRFFCVMCELLANCLDSSIMKKFNEKATHDFYKINSIWDCTWTGNKNSKRYVLSSSAVDDNFPEIVRTSGLIDFIVETAKRLTSNIALINNGSFSFKNLWEGAYFKNKQNQEQVIPFYYVFKVQNWSSEDPFINPFSKATELLTKDIDKLVIENKKSYNEILAAASHANVGNSCVINQSVGNIAISQDANGEVSQAASCNFETVVFDKSSAEKTPKEKYTSPKSASGFYLNDNDTFEKMVDKKEVLEEIATNETGDDKISVFGMELSPAVFYAGIVIIVLILIGIAIGIVFAVRKSKNKESVPLLDQSP